MTDTTAPVVTPEVVAPVVTPPVVQAPVVTPAAPEVKQENTPAPAFEKTGDARIDLAMDFFIGTGLTEDSYEIQAAAQGDFGALKAHLAKTGKAGWEQYLGLAEQGLADFQAKEGEAQKAREEAVYAAVGGEENFVAIAGWVAENAEPEEKEAIKGAFAQGGFVASAVASFLAQQYAAASGTTLKGQDAVSESAPYKMQEAPKPGGYRAEVKALRERIGAHNMDASPEYAALRQRYAGQY